MERLFIHPSYLERSLTQKLPCFWLNDRWLPIAEMSRESPLNLNDVYKADSDLRRLAPLLAKLFPELEPLGGIIESSLFAADAFQEVMMGKGSPQGRWFIKGDHDLPVAGSIKARGGIYEILLHAEKIALEAGLMEPEADPCILANPATRALFAQHQVAVGSTGNLGLSIGVIAAALGFRTVVHMSSDAKAWKKERLRARGVEVIEHVGDYGVAVAAARVQARQSRLSYFVDDENSKLLFLGYSVAAIRLQQQLKASGVTVDADHPLFVYLPCGVGGAPGGITFGLRHLFGDHVHCFFAEPVASPCMLIRLASGRDRPISVREVGLDNRTEADGLAVGQASEFVAPLIRTLVSGIFTVCDEHLFQDLYLLKESQNIRVEPSAAAGFRGPRWLLESEAGNQYREGHDLDRVVRNAVHVLWTTGGAFVPDDEYRRFHARGASLIRTCQQKTIS